MTDTTGVVTELEATGRDISDRRRAEEQLADHKAHTHALLCALPHLTFAMTREGVYLDYHAKDPRDLFVPPEQFLGKNIRDIMPPEIADKITAAFASLDDGPEPAIVDYSLPLSGEERHFEARLIAYGPDRILSVVRDITNRRRNEAALIQHAESLRASHERIQDLAGRLIASQEAERQRIARDLHDDLSQKLALLNIDIDLLAEARWRRAANGPRASARFRGARAKSLRIFTGSRTNCTRPSCRCWGWSLRSRACATTCRISTRSSSSSRTRACPRACRCRRRCAFTASRRRRCTTS